MRISIRCRRPAGGGVSGCASSNKTKPAVAEKTDDSSLMISPDLLNHAGLKTTWDQKLPLKEGEKFASVTLLGDRLYLRSDRNYLWSLDRVTGNVIFSRSLASTGIPVLGLTSYENTLISVIGNKLVELDIHTGKEQRVSDLVASSTEQGAGNVPLSIVAPPARNNRFFYIGAADRRLHVFRADDLVQTFSVTADDDSLITTVLADDSLVAFGTDAGDLVGMTPDAPTKLWQFKAPRAVAGSVIRDGVSFYFASIDTQVYRVDVAEDTGATLIWKYQTEAVLDRSPRVTRDFVYQYAPGRGLTALAKQSGQGGLVAAGRRRSAGRSGRQSLRHYQDPYPGRHGQRDGQEALLGELRPRDRSCGQYDGRTNLPRGRRRPGHLS